MWPEWYQTAIAAIPIALMVVVLRPLAGRPWPGVRALGREVVVVLVLYSIWQWVGSLSLAKFGDAFTNGAWIWRLERAWHLPSELVVQAQMLRSMAVTRAADLFYATVHAPALGVFLVWLWFRHRDRYPWYRNNLALVTGACLVVQLIPVAPPRMFPGLGFVDTLHTVGPIDVYGPVGQGLSDQVGAMPSIHCAWALLVGVGVVMVSRSRWRWLALAHPLATFVIVASTGNHWWLDGAVAAVLLGAAWGAQRGVLTAGATLSARRAAAGGMRSAGLALQGHQHAGQGEEPVGAEVAHGLDAQRLQEGGVVLLGQAGER